MQLPFGINISLNGNNNKYVKQKECHEAQDKIRDCISLKFKDYSLENQQKLLELKTDLIDHISIQMQMVRDLIQR